MAVTTCKMLTVDDMIKPGALVSIRIRKPLTIRVKVRRNHVLHHQRFARRLGGLYTGILV